MLLVFNLSWKNVLDSSILKQVNLSYLQKCVAICYLHKYLLKIGTPLFQSDWRKSVPSMKTFNLSTFVQIYYEEPTHT